LLAPSIN